MTDSPITFNVQSPNLWTPDAPHLYDVTITMKNDTASTYVGFRTITRTAINGVQRIMLVCLFAFLEKDRDVTVYLFQGATKNDL